MKGWHLSPRMKPAIPAVFLMLPLLAVAADQRKDFRFTVQPGANVTIINEYGPIALRGTLGRQVIITASTHSDKAEVYADQTGNRIKALTYFSEPVSDSEKHIEYEVQVPMDSSVLLRSGSGLLSAEKMHGDVVVKGDATPVEVREVSNAHVHVQTMSGPITLSNITGGHVEITSTSGKVTLTSVTGSKVSVNTTTSDISYDGDFGGAGEYDFSNHSGNIDVTAPATASVDITARSVSGSVQNDFPLKEKTHPHFTVVPGQSFSGTSHSGSSSVELRTFSGKIRVRKH